MALVWQDHWDQRIVVATLTEHGGSYYFFAIREMHRRDQIADPPSIRRPQINKTSRSVQFRLQTQITTMHFHFSGPARLHLIPHINAPVADLTLPYGRIVHDYLV